jgi:hypothetical protein
MSHDKRFKNLRRAIKCPHCWEIFPPEDIRWVSVHSDLLGDPRLGDEANRRFTPTRFNVTGNALDAKGSACSELACPECHLSIARPLLEMQPWFASIAGTPSCGKSFFLTAMINRLRDISPEFAVSFVDADSTANRLICDYEERLFYSETPDAMTFIDKTDTPGLSESYDQVRYGAETKTHPRPFLFSMQLTNQHPNYEMSRKVSRVLCLYDNSGESFRPGTDDAQSPVTRHMAHSRVLFFCFDPTQDPSWRDACKEHSQDVQIQKGTVTARQEIVFNEMIERIRKHTGLSQDQQHSNPLVIIVTKFDAWGQLMTKGRLPDPWQQVGNGASGLNLAQVTAVSDKLRSLLKEKSPSFVHTAERFANKVLYVPVSATGTSPDSEQGGFYPKDITPMWCEIPMLASLARWGGGIIPYIKETAS